MTCWWDNYQIDLSIKNKHSQLRDALPTERVIINLYLDLRLKGQLVIKMEHFEACQNNCSAISQIKMEGIPAMVYEYQVVLKTTMSNARRGLPLTKSHIQKIFPRLMIEMYIHIILRHRSILIQLLV